jgi:hypothetical protein
LLQVANAQIFRESQSEEKENSKFVLSYYSLKVGEDCGERRLHGNLK